MERTAGPKSIACILSIVSLAWVACAIPATADDVPSYAQPAAVPSYAHPNNEQTIRGRIQSVDGTYRLSVLDQNTRFVDQIGLHQGTVITPTGITLEPGMDVTISGHNAGAVFEANRIDTPYNDDSSDAYYVPSLWYPYYGSGWWYPGFGSGFGIGFGIYGGFRGGFYRGGYGGYGGYGRGGYGYRGGYSRGSYSRGYSGGGAHAGRSGGSSGGHSSGGGHPHR